MFLVQLVPLQEDMAEVQAWPPCLWQRRRQFPESPKHPIDCPTGLAEPCWYPGPPFHPLLCYPALLSVPLPPSLFLTPVLYPRPPSAAALGMANTPSCRVYVSGMRPPPPLLYPHSPIHPSLVHVMLGASQYGRQLTQPSPLFLP